MVPPIADSSGEARDDHTEPEQSDDATVGGDTDLAVYSGGLQELHGEGHHRTDLYSRTHTLHVLIIELFRLTFCLFSDFTDKGMELNAQRI